MIFLRVAPLLILFVVVSTFAWFLPEVLEPSRAVAAESIAVDNLPKDAKEFRRSVDQILKRVDGLIAKAGDKEETVAVRLDLMQTRDNIRREIEKLELKDGSKWTAAEARQSVELMLKLLKKQYDRAADLVG